MMKVLDHGVIELQEHAASDLSISTSARVIRGSAGWREGKDEKLLRYMLENHHTSPFEHGYLRFYVEAPLFVIRQWQRHRTWSYNEQSGRYENEQPKYYVPDRARLQDTKNRQNSIFTDDNVLDFDMAQQIDQSSHNSYQNYLELLDWGIAREQARILLPQNIYHRMVASVDPHNFMHFLFLRMHKDAQYEIREYAIAAYQLWSEIMPVTAKIFSEIHKERFDNATANH